MLVVGFPHPSCYNTYFFEKIISPSLTPAGMVVLEVTGGWLLTDLG